MDINKTHESEAEDKEREITEIINEIKKIDSSKLPNVLNFVKELQPGAEEIHDAKG